MKRVSFHTLGCRLNQAETALLTSDLLEHGYQLVEWGEPAEVVVVNTCAVTGIASRKSRQVISLARRRHPHAFLVVCGCAASDPGLMRGAWGRQVDLLLPNPKPQRLSAYLPEEPRHPFLAPLPVVEEPLPEDGFVLPGVGVPGERTRAYLKVQDGCSFRCTYCIVPSVRGPARSRSWEDVLREAGELSARGYRELVVTGVNVATYRQPQGDLADLLEALLALPGDFRIRLGSVEPGPCLERVIDLMARNPRMCRFLHLPLQYGEAGILRRMGRRYTVEEYAATVRTAAERIPDICLGTDVMVGFPGEDDAAFEECFRYLESLPLALMHVFCYSPRPGTPAAEWPARPPAAQSRPREKRLLALGERKAREFAVGQVGQVLPVLLEEGAGRRQGWSDNYLSVVVPSLPPGCEEKEILPCRIRGVLPGNPREVVGEVVPG